jgi:hypothetical protein
MLGPRQTAAAFLTLVAALSDGAWFGVMPAAAQAELVLHKEGTPFYHRPTCPIVRRGVGVLALTRGQAEARGYKAHPDCDPSNRKGSSAADGVAAPSAPPPARAAEPPIVVYVDGPKYYHRKTCPKLDASSKTLKQVTLERGAKTHWPCPTCKAPIFRRNVEPAVPGTNRRRGG